MEKVRSLSISMLLILFISISAQAQWYESGLMLGTSNYMGDLSEKGMEPTEYNTAFGIFGRYNYNKYVSFKAFFSKAKISGSDENNTFRSGLRKRNLNFRSNILEFGVVNEFNLAPYDPRETKIMVPYVFGGVAGFYYSPQAEFKGNWYNLRPLGTEGQGELTAGTKKYSSIALAIPYGLGVKWNISHQVNLGFEFGMRITLTDYLDDVSGNYPDITELGKSDPLAATLSYRSPEFLLQQMENPEGKARGNPDNNDWYFIGGVTLSINLTDKYGMEWEEKYKQFSEHEKQPFFNRKKKLAQQEE